ncbi:RNA 2',3'-cyclic phosphodiesterase [Priestia koreensis]|uniref:RNA 2',3'-cyclic phosphodiesterase n=1 Tax=Priestia koreensis TaxID=284581 RepID=UPI003457E112
MTIHTHFFIAIPLPSKLQMELTEWKSSQMRQLPFKQWTHLEDYHITLSFLGEADSAALESLTYRLQEVAQEFLSFDLTTEHLHTFGNDETPRILWLGVEQEPLLNQLQSKVRQICDDSGFQTDNRLYTPHITIAKKWQGEETFPINEYEQKQPIFPSSFSVEAFYLYRIHMDRQPKYEAVESFSLRNNAAL